MMEENESKRSAYSIELSHEKVKEVIEYNPNTGSFTRKGTRKAGYKAEYYDESKDYMMVYILGYRIPAHRLAWFYVHGEWKRIDHKNQIRGDNRLINLRPATPKQNSANQSVRMTNLLGVKGVQERNGKFRAYITVDYQTLHLGTFKTIGEAVNARRNAEQKYFGEFAPERQD